MQDSLVKLDAVRLALEKARTVQEVKNVRDMARAAEVYAQQQKAGKDIQLQMSEYILRAERKLGELLKAAKANGQITHAHDPKHKAVVDGDDNRVTTLAQAGISRDLSSRAQKLAAIPEPEFEQKLAEQKAAGNLSAQRLVKTPTPKTSAPKEHKAAPIVIALHDQGLTSSQIAEQTGVSQRQIRHIREEEEIRRKAKAEEPEITPEMLSLTAQQKLDLAIKQQIKKLEQEYTAKVEAAAWRYLDLTVEQWNKEQAEAKRIMHTREGFMTKKTYKLILSCLHPDRVSNELKERYGDAFREFNKLEKFLLDEKDSPTQFVRIPTNRAEWEKARAETSAARKAARKGKKDLAK
jgi:hypothetical protein